MSYSKFIDFALNRGIAKNSFTNVISIIFLTRKYSKKMLNSLPFFVSGEIVRGFGRGSKELGIPTANFPSEVVQCLPESISTGVYFGWANVDNGEVFRMVMSIGWNPYYVNKEKSMETHILHKFNTDLYGHLLKVCIVGYLRPEENFKSLDELITAIQNDITNANNLLDSSSKYQELKDSPFFKETPNNICKDEQTNVINNSNKNGKDSR